MAGADCAPNSVEYWDDFYDDRRSAYDTLYGYEDLRTLLLSLMPLDSRRGQSKVLHAGCGTSNVTDGLWRDGFRSILNIDFSDVVVKLMADRWSDRAALSTEGDAMLTGVQWQQMDLTDLSQLASAHFDMVLEKFTRRSTFESRKKGSANLRSGYLMVSGCHSCCFCPFLLQALQECCPCFTSTTLSTVFRQFARRHARTIC